MKRTSIFYFSLAAIAIGCFASCQDYNPLDENTLQKITAQKAFEATLNEYTKNFEDRYGKIDPNHDWGMFMPGIKEEGTRSALVNRNEWIDKYHLQVPGWPDTFETSSGGTGNNGYHYLDTNGSNARYSTSIPSNSLPAGDVTDEEIQYVSWWFRTNQYPESVNLHWTDFYVQGISADNDRDESGNKISTLERYEKKNGNWVQVTGDDNVTYTIDYFSAEMLQPTLSASDGNWDHINNFNRNGSNQLDVINTIYVGPNPEKAYSLDASFKNNSIADITNRLIMFYESSGTENFEAHYSQSNKRLDWNIEYNEDGTEKPGSGHSSWVLRHLHFTGPSGRVYDGYYLAFDYQIFKEENGTVAGGDLSKYTLHKADGYYSNWIFKLSPAIPHTTTSNTGLSRRIMCEDLGNTFDFDFNDVVFDATYNISTEDYNAYLAGTKTDSPIDVTIRLQAAGGTLPIYVGVEPAGRAASMEAHQLLGNTPSNTPVNVDAPNGVTKEIAIYHYKLPFTPSDDAEVRKQSLSLNNIPIYVQDQGNKGTYLTTSDSYWGNEYTPEANRPRPDNTGVKSAPRAFGVPVGVSWMKECKFIETSYTRFDDWVRDQVTWGDNATTPWYMADIENIGNVYTYVPYEKPTASGGSSFGEEVTEEESFEEYGTQVSVTETPTTWGGAYNLIPFNAFSGSDSYELTFVCHTNNQRGGIQEPKLVQIDESLSSPNDNGALSANTISSKDSNGNYTVSFVVPSTFVTSGTFTQLLVKELYGKGDKIKDVRVREWVQPLQDPFTTTSASITLMIGETKSLSEYIKDGVTTTPQAASNIVTVEGLNVSGVSDGTTSITMSFAGNETYKEGTITISVTVIDPESLPYRLVEYTGEETQFGTEVSHNLNSQISHAFDSSLFASATEKVVFTLVLDSSTSFSGKFYVGQTPQGDLALTGGKTYQVIFKGENAIAAAKAGNIRLDKFYYPNPGLKIYVNCQ